MRLACRLDDTSDTTVVDSVSLDIGGSGGGRGGGGGGGEVATGVGEALDWDGGRGALRVETVGGW